MNKLSEISIEDRYAVIALTKHANWKQERVANQLHINQASVSRTLKRYNETGSVEDIKGRGRKRVPLLEITDNNNNHPIVKAQRTKREATAKDIQSELDNEYDIVLEVSTIQKIRKQLGFRPVHYRRRPKFGKTTKTKRLYYCLDSMDENWREIIFTDESWYILGKGKNVIYKRPSSPPPEENVTLHQPKVMVWGGIWWEGRTQLCFIEGKVDAKKYQEIVYKHLVREGLEDGKEVLQDGAKAHTAESTMDFFDNAGVDIRQNPPSSPELNPIEKVWGWIKDQLSNHTIESLEQMIELVKYYWENIPQATIQSFIEHNKTVVNDIIQAEGGTIPESHRPRMRNNC